MFKKFKSSMLLLFAMCVLTAAFASGDDDDKPGMDDDSTPVTVCDWQIEWVGWPPLPVPTTVCWIEYQ